MRRTLTFLALALLGCADGEESVPARPGGVLLLGAETALGPGGGSVTLTVSAFDHEGGAIVEVTPARISADAVSLGATELRFVAPSVAPAPLPDGSAFSLAVVLDQSGSMIRSDPEDMRLMATRELWAGLRAGEESALWTFEKDGHAPLPWMKRQGLTGETARLQGALEGLERGEGGETPMFDTVGAAVADTAAAAAAPARGVLLLTDGRDTASTAMGFAAALAAARRSGVRIVSIGMSPDIDVAMLCDLSLGSGGGFALARSTREVGPLLRGTTAWLRGGARPLTIRLSARAGGPGLPPSGSLVSTLHLGLPAGHLSVPFHLSW